MNISYHLNLLAGLPVAIFLLVPSCSTPLLTSPTLSFLSLVLKNFLKAAFIVSFERGIIKSTSNYGN